MILISLSVSFYFLPSCLFLTFWYISCFVVCVLPSGILLASSYFLSFCKFLAFLLLSCLFLVFWYISCIFLFLPSAIFLASFCSCLFVCFLPTCVLVAFLSLSCLLVYFLSLSCLLGIFLASFYSCLFVCFLSNFSTVRHTFQALCRRSQPPPMRRLKRIALAPNTPTSLNTNTYLFL